MIISQHPFASYAEPRSDPARIPTEFKQTEWNEFEICMDQRDLAFNSLRIDLSDYYHPKSVRCIAIRELVVGTLIPGTRLEYYLEHNPVMYYYNRNTAVVNIHLSPTKPCPAVTRMFTWSNFLLLKDIKNELVRPSCLFANTVHSDRELDPSSPQISYCTFLLLVILSEK